MKTSHEECSWAPGSAAENENPVRREEPPAIWPEQDREGGLRSSRQGQGQPRPPGGTASPTVLSLPPASVCKQERLREEREVESSRAHALRVLSKQEDRTVGALSNGYFLLRPHPAASCHRKGADGAGAQAERHSCWGLLRWQVAGLGLTTSHRSPGQALPSHDRAAGPSRGPRSRALTAHRPGFAKSHPCHLLNHSPHHHHRRLRPLPATAGITVVPDGSASSLAPSFPTEGFSLNQVQPPPQAGGWWHQKRRDTDHRAEGHVRRQRLESCSCKPRTTGGRPPAPARKRQGSSTTGFRLGSIRNGLSTAGRHLPSFGPNSQLVQHESAQPTLLPHKPLPTIPWGRGEDKPCKFKIKNEYSVMVLHENKTQLFFHLTGRNGTSLEGLLQLEAAGKCASEWAPSCQQLARPQGAEAGIVESRRGARPPRPVRNWTTCLSSPGRGHVGVVCSAALLGG
ncbi:uncharacterized protein LOC117025582 [Rhinolophus ferrumequinum]|uniref:uncharacterized protein LOC117025582 n=1 Tax=Rhinolophus ferrumequinum TaxID=59479 RepID=UPI00140FEBC1|nr:uncharacterized protein LOC117025582 [Rhinolophus ferrumequinum]